MKNNIPFKTVRLTIIGLLAFATLTAAAQTQAVKEYDFPGKYQNRSAQGMAVYGDSAFLLNDQGHCRIYHLPTKKLVHEFDLSSAGADNHANSGSFGVEFPKGNKRFPALYVAQCRADYLCFVESVGKGDPVLLQTLQIKTGTAADKSYTWVVDRGQKCLYTLAMEETKIDQKGTNRVLVTKLPLPSIVKSKVTFGKEDILEQFRVEFANLHQGAAIRGDYLYLPVGLHESHKSTNMARKSREVIVINLKTKKIERRIDLNADVKDEPEDADFHGDSLLVYVGQAGGLFKVKGL